MSISRYSIQDLTQKIVGGGTPSTKTPRYWDGNIPWISSADITESGDIAISRYISEEAIQNSATNLVPQGTVIIVSRVGVGKAAIAPVDLCFSQDCQGLILKHKLVNEKYFIRAIRQALSTLRKKARGTTITGVTKKDIIQLAIALPPLPDQIRIADILSKAESLIRQRKESLRLLDESLKSTFLEMFGDPVRNEKGRKKVRLSEICSKIGSGATPRGGKESYKSEGIKLIRSMNVHNNTFIFDGLVFIDEAQASKLDHVIVKPNDVLLNITGASVGRCCLAPKEVVPARVNQHVSIIRPDSNVINPVFLSRVLTNTHFQAQIVKEAKLKGATREAITKEEIERMEVPLPNKRFQSLFATIVEKTELLKARQQHSLKELSTLYGSLSQRAFQGELDLREEPLANAAEPEVVYHKARK